MITIIVIKPNLWWYIYVYDSQTVKCIHGITIILNSTLPWVPVYYYITQTNGMN